MEPVVLALKNKYDKDIEFIVVDVNTPDGGQIAQKYNVYYIPAIFIIKDKKNCTYSESGVVSQAKLEGEIKKVI
jgi:cytochrome c-type biogenesis protein